MAAGGAAADATAPIRVLIVDDDESLRFLVERELRKRLDLAPRLEIVTAAEPEEGLARVTEAERRRPLFVLADYDLRAAITGADLLERVRRLRPDAIRVLFSGRPRSELAAAIAHAEPRAFLEKPLRVEGLVDDLVPLIEEAGGGPRAPADTPETPAATPDAPVDSPEVGPAAARAPPASAVVDERIPVDDAAADGESGDDVYRAIVDSVTDYAIFLLDTEGRVRTWNRGAEKMKRYSAEEIIGRHFSVFYPPGDIADLKPQYEIKIAAEEGRFEDTGWRVRKDGSMFWANVVITAVRDERGRLRGFAKVTRDLTERRHHEEALRQTEERYRLLIESVKDYAIFLLDPKGRIASWNIGAQRIKGYSAGEIIGEHFSKFYPEEDRARKHPEHELELAIQNGAYQEEGWRLRKDGSRFWASVVITALFDADGELRGFAKVTRDLTERRRAEEDLRERARLLSDAARELEAFNYTVAHDLRAPLRAIIHLTEALRADDVATPEERARMLDAVHASGIRMAQLVEDLLALSRATKGDIVRERVDVSALAREVFDELASRMGARAARLRVQPGLSADADPRMLRIVLENLLSNALKFSRAVTDPVVRVGHVDTGAGPAFFVADNGVGFDPTQSDRLFRPFQRLHAQNEFEGTGIGLATVARIVARHGGRAWAEGRPKEGATVYFTLEPPVRAP